MRGYITVYINDQPYLIEGSTTLEMLIYASELHKKLDQ